jgi:hypothetical protein
MMCTGMIFWRTGRVYELGADWQVCDLSSELVNFLLLNGSAF